MNNVKIRQNRNFQFAFTNESASKKDFVVNYGLGLFIVYYRESYSTSYDGYCILRVYDNNPVLVALTRMKNDAGISPLSCNSYAIGTSTVTMNVFQYCNVLFITY